MKTLMKYAITFALVLSALAAAASNASASSGLRLPGGALTITASGTTTLTFSGINITCNLNVTLAINSSISKAAGTALGSITGGTIASCNDGSVGTITNLPVGIRFMSFTGTLPTRITGINAAASPLMYTVFGGFYPPTGCQFTASLNLVFAVTSNAITTFRFAGTSRSTTPGCPPSATIVSSSFTLTGALRSVQVSLV